MNCPSPYTEIKNRQTLFIPGRQSTVVPSAPLGLLYPGDKGVPDGLIPTFKKGFAPRVGFAWDPTGSSEVAGDVRLRNLLRTVLHGPGRTAAITDQRASLSADSAAQPPSQFSQPLSLLRTTATLQPRPVCNSADQSDGCAEPAPALLAGLGLEHSTVLRLGPAV